MITTLIVIAILTAYMLAGCFVLGYISAMGDASEEIGREDHATVVIMWPIVVVGMVVWEIGAKTIYPLGVAMCNYGKDTAIQSKESVGE